MPMHKNVDFFKNFFCVTLSHACVHIKILPYHTLQYWRGKKSATWPSHQIILLCMYSKLSVLSFSLDRLVTKTNTKIVIRSVYCCFITKREEARLSSSLFVIKMMTKNWGWHLVFSILGFKSDNPQYNSQVRWADGTNDLTTKPLTFQAFLFHNFLKT